VFKFELTQDLFMRSFARVKTRCFGWNCIVATMAPFADNVNHSDEGASMEFVNT
jgi:hypothetical protein